MGMYKTSDEIDQLLPALLKAQAEIETLTKSQHGQTGNIKYMYADINKVLAVCKKPLNDAGLVLIQNVDAQELETNEKGEHYWLLTISTKIIHAESSQYMNCGVQLPAANSPKAYSSAVTYGRRYGLVGMIGLEQEDDDGTAAQGIKRKSSYQKRKDGDWPKREKQIRSLETVSDCHDYKLANREWYAELPPAHKEIVDDELDRRIKELEAA